MQPGDHEPQKKPRTGAHLCAQSNQAFLQVLEENNSLRQQLRAAKLDNARLLAKLNQAESAVEGREVAETPVRRTIPGCGYQSRTAPTDKHLDHSAVSVLDWRRASAVPGGCPTLRHKGRQGYCCVCGFPQSDASEDPCTEVSASNATAAKRGTRCRRLQPAHTTATVFSERLNGTLQS